MATRLVIWVEGDRDRRFVDAVIKPRWSRRTLKCLSKSIASKRPASSIA